MKTTQATLAAAWLTASLALAVPSEINYQGVLTDSQGNLVNGNQTMSLKIYDSPTGGTLLYSEDLGTVPVNNGVYNFTFGANGTSNALTNETVATTNGTASTFQKVLSASSIVNGSVTVTDGNYTWDQTNASSNENDFGISYSSSLRRVTVTYYNSAPEAGKTISASYRTPVAGISGAIGGSNQPWLETTINGTAQTPRQKCLTVPFAIISADSQFLASQVKTISANLTSVQDQTGTLSSNITFLQIQSNQLTSNLTTTLAQTTALSSNISSLQSQIPALSSNISAQMEDIQTQLQRINMTGTSLPRFISGNATSSLILSDSNASYISSDNSWSSKVINPPDGGGSATNPLYTWVMTYEAKINCICSQISGYIEVNSVYNSSNGRLDIVYADGTITTALSGISSRNFLINPNPNAIVKSIRFYGKSDNGYGISVYGKNLIISPVSSQSRYVDINLSSSNIQTISSRLVTDSLNFSNLKYSLFSGSTESQKFDLGITNTMNSTLTVTKVRLYLISDNESADLSGSNFKMFSFKY